jgi:hypothetical protein
MDKRWLDNPLSQTAVLPRLFANSATDNPKAPSTAG